MEFSVWIARENDFWQENGKSLKELNLVNMRFSIVTILYIFNRYWLSVNSDKGGLKKITKCYLPVITFHCLCKSIPYILFGFWSDFWNHTIISFICQLIINQCSAFIFCELLWFEQKTSFETKLELLGSQKKIRHYLSLIPTYQDDNKYL